MGHRRAASRSSLKLRPRKSRTAACTTSGSRALGRRGRGSARRSRALQPSTPPKKKRSCFLTSGLSRFSVSWGGLAALTGLSWLVFWFRLGSWVFDTLACNKFFGLSALRGNRNMFQCGQDSDRRWGRVDSCDQLELDRGHAC